MKYVGQTLEYLKKHLWLPFAAMIIPSVAACFFSTPYWEVAFVADFDYVPYRTAGETFHIMFGDSWKYLWPVVLVGSAQVLGSAFVMSAMDRHFRTGGLSGRSAWSMINNSVFPVAIGVIVMSVISIILRFLLFGLISLVQAISGAAMFSSGATLAIISTIAVGLFIFHIIIITPVLFWAPIMFIYGYKFRDAAATSYKLISQKKLYGGLLVPTVFCAGLQLLMGFLQVHAAIGYSVNFVVALVTNVFITVYVMISFYDICGLERRDIKPYQRPIMPPAVVQTAQPEQKRENTGKTPETSAKPQKRKPVKKHMSTAGKTNPEHMEGSDVV